VIEPKITPKNTAVFQIQSGVNISQYEHVSVLSKRNDMSNVKKLSKISTNTLLDLILLLN